MAEIDGSCDPVFHSVRDLLQQKLRAGSEVGASLCVNIDGKNVLDLWGGHADESKTKPWKKDTITGIWSCTKIITGLAAHMLVDRGLLDMNEKVATYWPEFAANGKDNVKVSHLLSHSSGVPAWEGAITAAEMQDVEKSTERLAGQAPWFAPGSQSAYQLTNHGHMIGELVRRIAGKPLTQFLAEEIATPLAADFQLGLPEADWARTADIVPFSPDAMANLQLDPTSILARALVGSLMIPDLPNDPGFRNAENGAIGGFANARALARIASIVSLDGTVDGRRYLAPETLDEMMKEQVRGLDSVLFLDVRFALGLALPSSNSMPAIPEDAGICFWGGWGGSMVVMDRGRRMTIAYVMNKMEYRSLGSANAEAYIREIYQCLDVGKGV
ncbi:beta-lactamase [Aspergillus bombycis]|uniref:Beta-lactamase n=1 Tax=Aspergillus bombycis TaxID=109264 RepID=A0A1F8A2H5_9EURO|nr:beta-lactamase [Aspergillus bombycis]OGM45518.1 beta-lactamase [Aspergillus bombycis]